MITDARIKDAGRKTYEDFFTKIFTSHFIARVWKGCWRVACERMLETERKLHILTPLLWPSRCVLFSWCWGPLHRGFLRAPSVGCGLPLPHLVSTVWNYTGNCIGGFRGPPRSGVAFPTTSRLSPSGSLLATASGVFRVPPRSGVAFPTTSGLYCLEFDWQLLWDPNSTELNNNSTPTRSPTGSLKSNV